MSPSPARDSRRRRRRARLFAAILGIAVAARPGAAAPLRVADDAVPPASLDPLRVFDSKADALLSHLFDGLLAFDRFGGIVPRLAERWSWDDPRRLRLVLRRGVRFHDGRPFDAAVVAENFARFAAEAARSPRARLLSTVEAVEVVGPYEVVLACDRVDGVLLHRLAAFSWMLPPGLDAPGAREAFAARPVGTGPYRFGARGDGWLRVDAVEGHWAGPPTFPGGIRWEFMTELDRISALIDGGLDVAAGVRPFFHRRIQEAPGVGITTGDSLIQVDLVFNTARPAVGDPRVRSAIASALSVPELIRYVARGNARPIRGAALPDEAGFTGEGTPLVFQPGVARALVREVAGGERISLRGVLDPEYLLLGRAIQVQLQKVGIDLDLEEVSRGELYRRVARSKLEGAAPWDGDLFVFSCHDPMYHAFFVHFLATHSRGPYSMWADPELDAAFEAAVATAPGDDPLPHWRALERRVTRMRPVIFLYQAKRAYGVRDGVDFRPTRSGLLDLRFSRIATGAGGP